MVHCWWTGWYQFAFRHWVVNVYPVHYQIRIIAVWAHVLAINILTLSGCTGLRWSGQKVVIFQLQKHCASCLTPNHPKYHKHAYSKVFDSWGTFFHVFKCGTFIKTWHTVMNKTGWDDFRIYGKHLALLSSWPCSIFNANRTDLRSGEQHGSFQYRQQRNLIPKRLASDPRVSHV